MQNRPSARLLILDPEDRVLLFFFSFDDGPLAGEAYWATPGGGLEAGESYEEAALRELREETGLAAPILGEIGRREITFRGPDGGKIFSEERYFLVHCDAVTIDRSAMTGVESKVIKDHKWWSVSELAETTETVFPEGLVEMLAPHRRH
ncbi:MAG: NUDIX domain-containing protein [Pseudomonadota bacterium]